MANPAAQTQPNLFEIWETFPYVTRNTSLVAGILFLVMILRPQYSLLFWRLPGAPYWQIWRYFTAPLSLYGQPLPSFIALYMWWSSLRDLETTRFENSVSRTTYFVVWIALGFSVAGPWLGHYYFLGGMINALTWVKAQDDPLGSASLGFVSLPLKYMPWVNVGIGFLTSASIEGAVMPLLGIVIAHSFVFVTEFLPQAGGPSFFAETPQVLRRLDDTQTERLNVRQHGPARRLGSEDDGKWWKFF